MNLKPSTVCVSLPEVYSRRKLNALYREIPLKDTTSRLLRKYFNAMANLYGIIPLRKAYEIISAQCRHPVSKEEFLSFSEIARHECEEYCLLGADELYPGRKQTAPLDREIIDITLVDGDLNAYHEMRHSQGGKPYYIPDRAELLAFDDPFYCEPTPAADALLQFMERCLRLKHDRAAALLAEFVYAARCLDAGISEVMAAWRASGFTSGTEGTQNVFARCIRSSITTCGYSVTGATHRKNYSPCICPLPAFPNRSPWAPISKRRLRMGRWMQRVWRRDSWIPHSTMSGCAKAC